jgi:hypothetical protein
MGFDKRQLPHSACQHCRRGNAAHISGTIIEVLILTQSSPEKRLVQQSPVGQGYRLVSSR